MVDLNRNLLDLFQLSDGLLLPEESVLEETSKKQRSLSDCNADMILQGLITMRNLLQKLASENQAGLANLVDEMDWSYNEGNKSRLSKGNLNFPSVFELTRHLSNWILVFIPPIQALGIRGDMELISCLESTDYHISTLATMMLGYKEFNYLGSIEKFSGMLDSKCQTSFRLETGRLIYTGFHDPQALRKEMVPNIIDNDDQYDTVIGNDVQRKRLLSYIRELVVWDIATRGEGPRRKWASWWA